MPNAPALAAAQRDHGVALHGPLKSVTTAQSRGEAAYGQEAFTIDWKQQYLPERRCQHPVGHPGFSVRAARHPHRVSLDQLPSVPEPERLRQLPEGPAQGNHTAAPRGIRGTPPGPGPPEDRGLEGTLQDPRRSGRHHLPGRPALRTAQIPLPRLGENQSPAPAHRRRDQPRPHRRPPHRNTPGPHPHQPLRSTSPRRIDDGAKHQARINQQHPSKGRASNVSEVRPCGTPAPRCGRRSRTSC